MERTRSKPTQMDERAEHCYEVRREAQRRLLGRLRREDAPKLFKRNTVSREEIAAVAGMSTESLRNFETGSTLLTEEMRARLIAAYRLKPSEWSSLEAEILDKLERSGYDHRQQELFVAERRPRYGSSSKQDEDD